MRISTSWSQQLGINGILKQQNTLLKTQQQLSTGLKNLTPADDPVAAKKILNFQQQIDNTTQYQQNIDMALSRNNLEASILSNGKQVLLSVRDLAVQALNEGLLNDSSKQAIQSEVEQIKDFMLGMVNSQDANGDYIFSGMLSSTAPFDTSTPYTYRGADVQRQLQISPQRTMSDGDLGSDIFGDIFKALDDLSGALDGSVTPYLDTVKAVIDKIDTSFTRMGNTEAKIGARLNSLESQQTQNNAFLVLIESNLSDLRDVDFAEAISRFELEQIALQAAQQSFSSTQRLSLFQFL